MIEPPSPTPEPELFPEPPEFRDDFEDDPPAHPWLRQLMKVTYIIVVLLVPLQVTKNRGLLPRSRSMVAFGWSELGHTRLSLRQHRRGGIKEAVKPEAGDEATLGRHLLQVISGSRHHLFHGANTTWPMPDRQPRSTLRIG